MDRSESWDLASLVILFDRIAELGRQADAAPNVVVDGGAASKKSADCAISTLNYSTKNNHHNQRPRAKGNTTEVE